MIFSLNIYDSINFSTNAWNSVSQQTINNCWRHTGILPQNEIGNKIEDYDDQAVRDEMELQDLINQLLFDDPMDIKEFLHIDDFLKRNEGLSDEKVISMVKSNNNKPETDPNEGELLEIISKREALEYLDDLVVFFEHSLNVSSDSTELNLLKKLRH
ncbi:hypothetical protein RhiirC2_797641 [Rhizophagus irregularis]|uniref:DDE-1 domain-containing protein n=1 Tax=Rhizophagus irregularis TaxID=588596 RepID=A0A2N1M7P4_9GLOM|nr:hypothetical protein RhiirC2_797641 [Rhizophagus irregularis]